MKIENKKWVAGKTNPATQYKMTGTTLLQSNDFNLTNSFNIKSFATLKINHCPKCGEYLEKHGELVNELCDYCLSRLECSSTK